MLSKTFLAAVALPAIASAHFQLVYPPSRGTNDENEYTGPCGGYDQTQNRTTISSTSFNLQLNLGHDHSVVTVLLALGNEVGGAFNTFLYPTIQEVGPGNFCLPTVAVPSTLNISEGTNGTIQVITDGHGGGLYMCSDVTFSSTAPQPATSCTNGTGLTASFLSNPRTLANGSSESSNHGSDTGNSSNATTTGSGGSGGNSAGALTVGWGVFGAAILAAVAVL